MPMTPARCIATASQVARVFVGEVTVSASVVASIRWYAYNGRYRGAATGLPGAATAYSNNHNIGVMPDKIEQRLVCTTTELGYAVGDEVVQWSNNGSNVAPAAYSVTALVVAGVTGNTNIRMSHKTTGQDTLITTANWSYKFNAYRGW